MVLAVAKQEPAVEMAPEHRLPAAISREIAVAVEKHEPIGFRADQLDVPIAARIEAVNRPIAGVHPAREGEGVADRFRKNSQERKSLPARDVAEVRRPDRGEVGEDPFRLVAGDDAERRLTGHGRKS